MPTLLSGVWAKRLPAQQSSKKRAWTSRWRLLPAGATVPRPWIWILWPSRPYGDSTALNVPARFTLLPFWRLTRRKAFPLSVFTDMRCRKLTIPPYRKMWEKSFCVSDARLWLRRPWEENPTYRLVPWQWESAAPSSTPLLSRNIWACVWNPLTRWKWSAAWRKKFMIKKNMKKR